MEEERNCSSASSEGEEREKEEREAKYSTLYLDFSGGDCGLPHSYLLNLYLKISEESKK